MAGKLYPVNNRAVRTIKNLYVVNERVSDYMSLPTFHRLMKACSGTHPQVLDFMKLLLD